MEHLLPELTQAI